MMTIDKFKGFIDSWKYCSDKAQELDKVGVNIYDLVLDPYWGIVNPLMSEIFTEEQSDMIDQYIYFRKEDKSVEQLYKEIYNT